MLKTYEPLVSEMYIAPTFPIQSSVIEGLRVLLSSPKKIAITMHHKPDADALGSSLALYRYLTFTGHSVQVISPSDYPSFLNWLPGQDKVWAFDPDRPDPRILDYFNSSDVIFCLDFNSLSRIQVFEQCVRQSSAQIVMIDHHLQPDAFAQFSISETKAAATAELIYHFICAMGDHQFIDVPLAECIYAGLVTDTGSFRHPSTSRTVHLIVADLLRIGVNPSKVHKLIYDNNQLNRLRFLGFVLKDKLQVIPGLHAAYIAISKEEISQYHVDTGDTEGIVNFALSIKGIVLGVVVIDRKDMVKISFRSIGDFDVNAFARKYFEGGGHKNAAGGKSSASLEETTTRLLAAIEENKTNLSNAYNEYFNSL